MAKVPASERPFCNRDVQKLDLSQPSEADMLEHRGMCAALTAFGEFAVDYIRRNTIEERLAEYGLTIGSIEAELRMIQRNFRMYHDPVMSPTEADEILKSLADEA